MSVSRTGSNSTSLSKGSQSFEQLSETKLRLWQLSSDAAAVKEHITFSQSVLPIRLSNYNSDRALET